MPVETIDPTDPWLREAQTFPVLSEDMIARISAYGTELPIMGDTFLFERGMRNIDFFVILEGELQILADSVRTGRSCLFVYHQGQFSGEQNTFNDRMMLLSGLAKAGSRVLRVLHKDVRPLMVAEPDIAEVIMRAYILRRTGFVRHAQGGVLLMGHQNHNGFLRIQSFLTRNLYPVEIMDVGSDLGSGKLMAELGVAEADMPAVVAPDHQVLRNPSNRELADYLGMSEPPEADVIYDVAVIGAGPAGLAASVYGASEGLNTILLESTAPGGQAGTSSKIENYLGFPTGISGQALAGRAYVQAQKFGTRVAVSRAVTKVDCSIYPFRVELEDGKDLHARSIVVASGARYRKLDVENYDRFEGQGIHYAATAVEAQVCFNEEVVVVGGGNSAGQAAVFLSRTAKHVHVLMRSGIASTMSDYLVQRIENSSRITLHQKSEITALHGDKTLQSATWINHETGVLTELPVTSIFVMIGAAPNTEWLKDCVDLDQHGFVRTGLEVGGAPIGSPYATSEKGIFAVGDVRSGSVKRVASAVGEGSVVISSVHQFLDRDAIAK